MVRDKPPSCAVPTCFEVIIACPNVTTLLAVNTLDKYELNDVLSGEPDSRDMKNGFALIIAGGKNQSAIQVGWPISSQRHTIP